MAVLATPVSPLPVTSDDVRAFMRDYAGQVPNTGALNVLLDDVEFSDTDIARAIRFTAYKYNAMTPVTNITPEVMNPYVLLLGTAAFLLRSESMRQLRNQATVQDGDVQPIGIDDKAQLYMQASKMIDDEYTQYARGIKTQMNMESAYGSIGSGYRSVARNHNA